MSDFKFDARKHCYTLDGKPLNGVTTVLGVINKPALVGWAARMTADWIRGNCDWEQDAPDNRTYRVNELELQEASKFHSKRKTDAGSKGTDVHALVEDYIKRCIDEKNGVAIEESSGDPMADKFIKWAMSNEVVFHESEKKMYSEKLWLAGTCDFTCSINGKKFVGDLKTMAKMWDRVPFFQTAAYMLMLEEQGEEYNGSVIININKETAELTEYFSYDHESDKEAFLACLTLYRKLNQ